MKTLIIDNYDSFTYNLHQYLAEVNGEEPDVIPHDVSGVSTAELAAYDNLLISPGPGHPANSGDFGICQNVVTHPPVPLLGVCLGHQGLCLAHGGEVGRADEVRHGRCSPVLHDGQGLFAGIPSPFEVVRYHSLTVTTLPSALTPQARTPEGVLMGVRHRTLPAWGVQFHPESIRTDHGMQLLANFARLTRTWQRENGRPPRSAARPPRVPRQRTAPTTASPPATTTQQPAEDVQHLRVLTEHVAEAPDPELLFEALYSRSQSAFWLDSGQPDAEHRHFSYLGDATGPLSRTVRADVWNQRVTVESAAGTEQLERPFLDWLDEDLRSRHVEVPDLPCDFTLGWVGYLGYELKAECGGDRAHPSPTPDAALLFADRMLAYDHRTGDLHLLALAERGEEADALAWLERTAQTVRALSAQHGTRERTAPAAPPQIRLDGDLQQRHDRERYFKLIDMCQEDIAAGESYEICLTNVLTGTAAVPAWDTYRYLRSIAPAPFGALLRFDELSVLSTSPERFLRVTADGTLESKPIKGTRPRGTNAREDEALRAELLSSEKDVAENLMIVDLVRNDFGRCAETGTVTVDKLFDVESYTTVHQLVSTVRARRREDVSVVDCVRACFPGGSMTGAPKVRTMQIIDELENGPRGVYSGALGYFSLSGAADLSIVIRTLVLQDDTLSFGVGGAITALSDRAEEYEETAVKAAALLRLTGRPFPGRREHGTAVADGGNTEGTGRSSVPASGGEADG